jgi:hypothetical protein
MNEITTSKFKLPTNNVGFDYIEIVHADTITVSDDLIILHHVSGKTVALTSKFLSIRTKPKEYENTELPVCSILNVIDFDLDT